MPPQVQVQISKQLHSNHMGIEKTTFLAYKSVYWVNMNADIENTIKQCSSCLEYQNMQLQEKTIPNKVLAKLWKLVGNIFMINNENLWCIIDYYSKFPVKKKVESLSTKNLI